jgi:hypothetical protein
MDTLDYLDKAFLDQDSDSVSVSLSDNDSSDDESFLEVDEYDEIDEEEEFQSKIKNNIQGTKKRKNKVKKIKSNALELTSLLKAEDVEYEKWREKIGKLDAKIIPLDKIVQSMKLKHTQKTEKIDNFEYDMISTIKQENELTGNKAILSRKEGSNSTNKPSIKIRKGGKKYSLEEEEQYSDENSIEDEKDDDDDDEDDDQSRKSDVHITKKVLNEIRGDIRSYSEAAAVFMDPMSHIIKTKPKTTSTVANDSCSLS